MAKLSIVTIVKNAEKDVERTLQSVIEQKNTNCEYIIVDGKSNDGTLAVVNRYKENINRIVSEEDTGIASAFNKGWRLATGNFVWFVNAGDTILPGAIENVTSNIEKNADVFYGDIYVKKRSGDLLTYTSNHSKLKNHMSIAHPATIVKRSVFNSIGGFDEQFRIAMDFDFLNRAAQSGCQFMKIPKRLSVMEAGGVSDVKWLDSLRESHKVRVKNVGNNLESLLIYYWSVLHAGCYRINSKLPKAIRLNRRDNP